MPDDTTQYQPDIFELILRLFYTTPEYVAELQQQKDVDSE